MSGARASGHTAIVTGANHGIGAATALALAQRGCAVLCTFLRVDDDAPGFPAAYRANRARDAARVAEEIRAGGGRAVAVEANLSDPAVPAALFDAAEEHLGPVDILVNNASGWVADTFQPYPGFACDPYKEYSQPYFGQKKVLKGGCWSTRSRLIRNTWRNFYKHHRRNIFAGFRTCAL